LEEASVISRSSRLENISISKTKIMGRSEEASVQERTQSLIALVELVVFVIVTLAKKVAHPLDGRSGSLELETWVVVDPIRNIVVI
jgi:hypothetical protein